MLVVDSNQKAVVWNFPQQFNGRNKIQRKIKRLATCEIEKKSKCNVDVHFLSNMQHLSQLCVQNIVCATVYLIANNDNLFRGCQS